MSKQSLSLPLRCYDALSFIYLYIFLLDDFVIVFLETAYKLCNLLCILFIDYSIIITSLLSLMKLSSSLSLSLVLSTTVYNSPILIQIYCNTKIILQAPFCISLWFWFWFDLIWCGCCAKDRFDSFIKWTTKEEFK